MSARRYECAGGMTSPASEWGILENHAVGPLQTGSKMNSSAPRCFRQDDDGDVAMALAQTRSRESKREDILAVLVRDHADLFEAFPALEALLPSPHAAHMSKREWERHMFRARNICRLVGRCSATGDRNSLHAFVLKHFDKAPPRGRTLRAMLPDPADEIADAGWITMYMFVLGGLLR